MADPDSSPDEVTRLIELSRKGSLDAESRLFELLESWLRRQARRVLRRQGADTLLQTTALVHEAWLKLLGGNKDYTGREHFLAIASRAMRSVLVDHVRSRGRAKRGGGHVRVPIEEAMEAFEERAFDLLELDDALDRLARDEPRQARIVELRFFGGLTIDETAALLQVSASTVERDWRLARMWLLAELGEA